MPKRNLKYDHDVDHCRPLPSIVDETGTLKDEIKLSDFENDLFYEKKTLKVVDSLVTDLTDTFPNRYWRYDLPFSFAKYTRGDTIKITFDGTEYYCTLKYPAYTLYVGNASLVSDEYFEGGIGEIVDTEEPFFIAMHDYNDTFVYITTAEPGEHTITIEKVEVETEIKQIEPKYIPGALIVETDDVYYVKDDLLGKAIKSAVQSGRMVCIYYQDTYYYPINIKLNVYNYGQTFVTVRTRDFQFSFKV